jgi:ABC-type amino acid transport system permease subunit
VTGAASGGYFRHIVAIAKRSLIKMVRTPEALIDVTLQPIIFLLLFTYIFGGAIGGTPGHYLTTLLPGTLVMGITACTMYGGARLAQDVTTGVFDASAPCPSGAAPS